MPGNHLDRIRASDLMRCAREQQGSRSWREAVAIALCLQEGVRPDALIANSLDEEPSDGLLPCSSVAHHAWRERLRDADRIVAFYGPYPPSGVQAGPVPPPARSAFRQPASGHPAPAASARIAGIPARPDRIAYPADHR